MTPSLTHDEVTEILAYLDEVIANAEKTVLEQAELTVGVDAWQKKQLWRSQGFLDALVMVRDEIKRLEP